MAKYSINSEFSSDDEPEAHDNGSKINYPNLDTLGDLSANSLDINDDQLVELLKKYKISHGPLVETTRNLYKRLLAREIKRDASLRGASVQASAAQQRTSGQQTPTGGSGAPSVGGLPQPITSMFSSSTQTPVMTSTANQSQQAQQQLPAKKNVSVGGKAGRSTPTPIITGTSRYAKIIASKNAVEVYSSDEDDANALETAARPPLPTKGSRPSGSVKDKQQQTQQQPTGRQQQLVNLGKRPLNVSSKAVDSTRKATVGKGQQQPQDEDDDDEDDEDFDVDQITDDESDDDDSDEETEDELEDEASLKTKEEIAKATKLGQRSTAVTATRVASGAISGRRFARRYLYAILAVLAVVMAYYLVSYLECVSTG